MFGQGGKAPVTSNYSEVWIKIQLAFQFCGPALAGNEAAKPLQALPRFLKHSGPTKTQLGRGVEESRMLPDLQSCHCFQVAAHKHMAQQRITNRNKYHLQRAYACRKALLC